MLALQSRVSQGDRHCPEPAENSSLLQRRLRWGKDWSCFQVVIRPMYFSCFNHATFHLLFNVFPTWLTHPRRMGSQSTVGLCCWRTISDVLGKFLKSFLTLPPPPASSVNCQNITLASDSKGVEVVSHLTQLIAVSGSSRQAQDPIIWRAVRTSPAHGKPYTVQRQGTLGGEQALLSHLAPNLLFHPIILARMSVLKPLISAQQLGHWGSTFWLLETQKLLKNHLKTVTAFLKWGGIIFPFILLMETLMTGQFKWTSTYNLLM